MPKQNSGNDVANDDPNVGKRKLKPPTAAHNV